METIWIRKTCLTWSFWRRPLQDALDAHREGVIVGPAVDEVALARAARRARRRDTSRALRTVVGGAA